MTWLVSNSIAVNSGSTTVSVSGGVNLSSVKKGWMVYIDNYKPVQALSGTSPDGSGNSTLTLVDAWPNSNVSAGELAIVPTSAPLIEAIKAINDVGTLANNTLTKLNEFATESGTVDIDDAAGATHTLKTLPQLTSDMQAAIDTLDESVAVHCMTEAEFLARQKERQLQYAASGFTEMGKAVSGWTGGLINQGMSANIHDTTVNKLGLDGRATVNVHGHLLYLDYLGTTNSLSAIIQFPGAPDGTETFDTNDGTYTKHASATLAFAAETATNKVILSRHDLAFIEVWEEAIEEKDVVAYNGCVQSQVSSYLGMALSNSLVAQPYSAYGKWDDTTKGYFIQWSTLTDAEKRIWVSDPRHNIYMRDSGQLVQVRYRMRVVRDVDYDKTASYWYIAYDRTGQAFTGIQGKGTSHASAQFGPSNSIYSPHRSDNGAIGHDDLGLYSTWTNSQSVALGDVHCVPIALVQRRNKGHADPVLNPFGSATSYETNGSSTGAKFYSANRRTYVNPVDCFQFASGTISSGSTPAVNDTAGSVAGGSAHAGRPDGKYYDAIYSDDVKDLRIHAHKVNDFGALLQEYWAKAYRGDLRGFGAQDHVRFSTATVTVSGASTFDPSNAGGSLSWGVSAADNGLGASTTEFQGDESTHWVLAGDNGEAMIIERLASPPFSADYVYWPYSSNTALLYGLGATNNFTAEFDTKFPVGTVLRVGRIAKSAYRGDLLTQCDIIGNPANYPAEWNTHGLPGYPLVADQDGNSLIPDDGTKTWKMSRRFPGTFELVLRSADNGASWTDVTADWNAGVDSVGNWRIAGIASIVIYMVFYRTKSDVFIDELAKTALARSPAIHAFQYYTVALGGYLTTEAIRKAPTATGTVYEHQLTPTEFRETKAANGATTLYDQTHPKHTPLNLTASTVSPSAKYWPELTVKDSGVLLSNLNLNLRYNEMKHDGTDWGSAETLFLDGGRTAIRTDDNGQKKRSGSMTVRLPHIWRGN